MTGYEIQQPSYTRTGIYIYQHKDESWFIFIYNTHYIFTILDF